jgi:hypothetical protein
LKALILEDAIAALENFFWQDADEFVLWLGARFWRAFSGKS